VQRLSHIIRSFACVLLTVLSGCTTLELATRPFEPEGPLARVHPLKVRIVVPAVQGKENTDIPAQESWTCLLALALSANGHDVSIGGPMPSQLLTGTALMGADAGEIHQDRGDSEVTIEVTGYSCSLFAVDFPYGSHLAMATLGIKIRARGETESIHRSYDGYAVGHEHVVREAQQWCVWDLVRDPEVVQAFTRAKAL